MCGVAYPSARVKGGVPGNKMAAVKFERSGTGAEPWSASLVVLAAFSNDIAAAALSVVSFPILRLDTARFTHATLN